jgi:hypothetical protein
MDYQRHMTLYELLSIHRHIKTWHKTPNINTKVLLARGNMNWKEHKMCKTKVANPSPPPPPTQQKEQKIRDV